MRDYAGIFKDLLVADNRAFIEQIKQEQARKKQELEADCQCNGGGFAYCEACHGE